MANALVDFPEVNQVTPLITLLEVFTTIFITYLSLLEQQKQQTRNV
jgi:citrate lyase synthetase